MKRPAPEAIMVAVRDRSPSKDGHDAHDDRCPVCDESPVVLVAIRHPVMRRWTIDLLETKHDCWTAVEPYSSEMLMDAIARNQPELVVVDSVDFPDCCLAALDAQPADRVIVIGPDPDPAYRSLALGQGAGGWVVRDHVGEELSAVMRSALGCSHEPCPPSGDGRPSTEGLVTRIGGPR